MICECGQPLTRKPYGPTPEHPSEFYRCGHCGRVPPEPDLSRDMENLYDFQE